MRNFDRDQLSYDLLSPEDMPGYTEDINWDDKFYMDVRTSTVKQYEDWEFEIADTNAFTVLLDKKVLVEVEYDTHLQSWQEV